jgi:hypothetical protein
MQQGQETNGNLQMNLVNELQVSAEKDDVLTVLRKTKRLASKLDRKDIADWLQSEQAGYASGQDVPEYRQVRGTLAMQTNGHIPAGYGFVMNGIQELPGFGINPIMPVKESISTVLSWIESPEKGHGIYFPIDRAMDVDRYVRSHVNPMFRNQVSFMLRLNDAQVKAIPEQIKDKVLDWACALECAGVTGDGLSFSAKEKELAHAITFNISGSHIEQLNNLGNNLKGNQ